MKDFNLEFIGHYTMKTALILLMINTEFICMIIWALVGRGAIIFLKSRNLCLMEFQGICVPNEHTP